jgi:pimeloyl-ACP methyl ester carboxylesterase
MEDLSVTIASKPFPHLMYHFVLTYSNMEAVRLCFSESVNRHTGETASQQMLCRHPLLVDECRYGSAAPFAVFKQARMYPNPLEQLAAEIPGAKKVVMAGTAHHPFMEKPAEFNQIVLDFLASLQS